MKTSLPSPADVYNDIAREYQSSKATLTAYNHIIDTTVAAAIGAVTGLDAIDLATGDGRWARYLKREGAAKVLGVDVSHEMIRLAREAETEDPIGCKYIVSDVTDLTSETRFDIATAAFLLNYATSHSELKSYCDAAHRLLKPKARFVGINTNMFVDTYGFDDWVRVGRRMTGSKALKEGDALTIRLDRGDGSEIVFDNYYLRPETYEAAFAKAGFTSFHWIMPTVSDEWRERFGDAFWRPLLERPQLIGFEAVA